MAYYIIGPDMRTRCVCKGESKVVEVARGSRNFCVVTDEQLEILHHALGLRDDGSPLHADESYKRNMYLTHPGTHDFAAACELVVMGLMFKTGPIETTGGGYYFHATENGKAVAANPLTDAA